MGQRLNIEIKKEGETLANSYYHWSAYTLSSFGLVCQILDSKIHEDSSLSNLEKAIKMLYATNAGFNEVEKIYIKEQKMNLNGIEIKDCINRNGGLISITPEGIKNTQSWEEGRVEINLDTETICFNVGYTYLIDSKEIVEDLEEYYDLSIVGSFDIDITNIPFNKFKSLESIFDLELFKCKFEGETVYFQCIE